MKNKAKQTLSILLTLTMILSVFAGCSETSSSNNSPISNEPIQVDLNKWVLISEKSVATWTGNNAITQTEYRYDDQGRLNYQKLTSDTDYIYSDFSYDSAGNVISCTETIDSDSYWAENLCSYTYDKNGRLIATKKIDAEGHEEITIEYDNNGNKIKESCEYYSNGELEEITDFEYTLKYENDLCVMAVINITGEEYYDSTPYAYSDTTLEKYYYDSNGNKVKAELYWDDDDGNVVVNGKHYELDKTITYTWQKLGDIISGTPDSNTTQPNDSNIIEEDNNYNDFPAPVELNLVSSNGKNSLMNSSEYTLEIDGLYLIKDTDGYNYLALTYTISTLSDYKIELKYFTDITLPTLTQNGKWLERYYNLSDECKAAYSSIISTEHISTELRPGQTKTTTAIYEIYDTSTDIYLEIMPDYADSSDSGLVRLYSFS